MRFEDINKNIQDANSNEPAFQEKAWEKMEALLDKHLPQEKKRRWPVLWFLFPLGTGLSLFFIFHQSADTVKSTALTEQKNKTAEIKYPGNTTSATNSTADKHTNNSTTLLMNENEFVAAPVNKPFYQEDFKEPFRTGLKRDVAVSNSKTGEISSNSSIPFNNPAPKKTGEAADDQIINKSFTGEPIALNNLPITAVIDQADTTEAKSSAPAPVKEKKGNKGNKFTLQFSLGPDISSVGTASAGKVTGTYGISGSYAISKHIEIRTGFFAGRKIYSADSADYHPPADFWNYYHNLQKVDANCLVYEIPLNIVYHFNTVKKHNWFASAGLSSYLMKKENYDYYYKNYSGQTQYRSWSTANENSHLFSIINISGGYQYILSNRLSLSAEPYIKIPVTGIGAGNVKLNSAGILFTLGYKPFLKNK